MTTKDFSLAAEIVQQTLKDMPVAILIADSDNNIQWANKAFQDFTGLNVDLLKGKNLTEFESSHFDFDNSEILKVNNEQPIRWLKRKQFSVNDADKLPLAVTTYTDITDQKTESEQLQTQLDELSTIDKVSGLLNHRAMLQNLEPLVSRSRRYQNPLSLVAMEVLNLDVVKQQYGQGGVDFSVKELSFLLKDQLRWADLVSRTSENQFMFILPETDKPSSMHLANKISQQVNELSIQYEENDPFKLEISLGVSAWEKGNDSVLLLRNAKQSLEVAKTKGAGAIQDC